MDLVIQLHSKCVFGDGYISVIRFFHNKIGQDLGKTKNKRFT